MTIDYTKHADETIQQYQARINTARGYVAPGQLPSLPAGGGASPTPLPGQTPSLPDTGAPASPLLSFANSLDAAVNLARKSRNASSLDMMTPYRGTVAASDFSQILGNLNNASDTTSKDLIKRATDISKPTFDTFTMDNNLYQVEKDATGKIVGTPTLIQKGKPTTPKASDTEGTDLADAKTHWTDPTWRASHPNVTWASMKQTFLSQHPTASSNWDAYYPEEPQLPPTGSGNWFTDFVSGLQGK